LLFTDISYQSFAPLRVFFHGTALYAQMISSIMLENISNTFSSFQKNSNLLKKNKELRDKILQIRTLDFVKRKDNEEKVQIINFQKTLTGKFKTDDIDIYKIASIDLKNYLCCSTHKIFLHNPNEVEIGKNVPVFAGNSFIGQIKNTYLGFIEVILFSDTKHILPIKSNFFYCDARGKGKPMLISCKLNKENDNFEIQIGDLVYTSGLGGIFLRDIEIGFISSISQVSMNEIEVIVTLKTNPLEETFYGIVIKEANEV
jgi:rod shape-determining protein MreC